MCIIFVKMCKHVLCAHVCIHLCVCLCLHENACVCVRVWVCVPVRTYMRECVCMYTFMYVTESISKIKYERMRHCVWVCTRKQECEHMYTYMSAYVWQQACVQFYVCACHMCTSRTLETCVKKSLPVHPRPCLGSEETLHFAITRGMCGDRETGVETAPWSEGPHLIAHTCPKSIPCVLCVHQVRLKFKAG